MNSRKLKPDPHVRSLSRSRALVLCLAIGLGGCADGGADRAVTGGSQELLTGQLVPLSDGAWTVHARSDGWALLGPLPAGTPAFSPRDTAPSAQPITGQIRIYAPDEGVRETDTEIVPLDSSVPGDPDRRFALAKMVVEGHEFVLSLPGAAQLLHPSPVEPAEAVFEDDNALWHLSPEGVVHRLTADSIDRFDYADLAGRQREGEVILYWATTPVWSPDGERIAYLTNREGVLDSTRSQSIWLLEIGSGEERALLFEAGRWFRPAGWLGSELIVEGSEPGVWAVDPDTGDRRRLDEGLLVAAASPGTAIAVTRGIPGQAEIRIITPNGDAAVVPIGPSGFAYAPQAVFSPFGQKLLLESTSPDGTQRQFIVYDLDSAAISPLDLSSLETDGWPMWVDDEVLLVNTRNGAGATAGSLLKLP